MIQNGISKGCNLLVLLLRSGGDRRKKNRKEVQHGSAKLRRATASTCRAFPRMFRASKTTSSNSNGQATNADTFWSLLEAVRLVARTLEP